MTRAFFFGCWNEPGHFMFAPGNGSRGVSAHDFDNAFHRDGGPHLDGNYAPRAGSRGAVQGRLCYAGEGATREDRQRITYDSDERPQGEYLLHQRGGFTLIAWWDRVQGDKRGACNSTFLLEGDHDETVMLSALARHFPHVLANLAHAGVELRNARPAPAKAAPPAVDPLDRLRSSLARYTISGPIPITFELAPYPGDATRLRVTAVASVTDVDAWIARGEAVPTTVRHDAGIAPDADAAEVARVVRLLVEVAWKHERDEWLFAAGLGDPHHGAARDA